MPDKQYYSPDLNKAAQRGEPSAVWRAGQDRRLRLIRDGGQDSVRGTVLVNGTGIGAYQARLAKDADFIVGLDIEFPRLLEAKARNQHLVCAAGENLPFASRVFSAVLSNEVLEHVRDDRRAVEESCRVLAAGGRFLIFCPNRGYPFETHGIYRGGE
jgi:SAM-dependent methyltransferase